MRFSDLDDLARKDETPEERTHHDHRRSELRAALYAGIAIRDARQDAGLSQTELAARIGIAQSALSRIEAGRANPTLGTLQRVTDALGVPLTLGVGSHEVAIPAA
jgi:ribosome-binding protein aMBF1 (putative translation factor)